MAPYNNIIGMNPEFVDPENGDFSLTVDSPAQGYGCQTLGESNQAVGITKHRISSFETTRVASMEVGGSISEDTIWNADTVWVTDHLLLENGVTLEIAPGTRIVFTGFWRVDVQGCLRAIGQPDSMIVFTVPNPAAFLPNAIEENAWQGLFFNRTSSLNEVSELAYCLVECAKGVGENLLGGAMYIADVSKLQVRNSIFRNNFAYFGGVVACEFNAAPVFVGNVWHDNFALMGGSAVYCSYSYPQFFHNTITQNVVMNNDLYWETGSIHSLISKPVLINNILWNNEDHYYEDNQLFECKPFYVYSNCIEFGYEGNIDADPLFWNAETDLFVLRETSPCIDAAIPLTIDGLDSLDVLGHNRSVGNLIDLGAIEAQDDWVSGVVIGPKVTSVDWELSAYPNPFNPELHIAFCIPIDWDQASIDVFNVKGQRVTQLYQGKLDKGHHSFIWSAAEDVSSGIYWIRIRNGNGTIVTRKVTLLK